MKAGLVHHMLLIVLSGLLFSQVAAGQNVRYKHPLHDISFEASPNWEQVVQDFNGREFRVTHPNHNMRISLSFVADCRNPDRYIRRMSGSKGMVSQKGLYDTVLNDQKAVIMKGQCLQGKKPFRRMVIGFPLDKNLYLMEICCPEECLPGHQENVRAILGTVRIGA